MKKILIVSTIPFNVNGITRVVTDYYNNFKTLKNSIDFAIPREINDNYKKELTRNNSKVFILPDRQKKTISYLNEYRKLLKNYDTVFVNGNSVTMLFETSIAKLMGKKVITMTHNSRNNHPLFNLMLKPLFNITVNLKLAVSKEAGNNIYIGSFETIENGVNTEKYKFNEKSRNEFRKKFNFNENDIVLICVGRISDVKNQSYLINIMENLDKRYKLFIIGDGPDKDNLEKKFYDKINKDRIIFTGNVQNVQDYMDASDIFLTPSLYEGFSLVVLECQCNGLPGVISDNNTPDVVIRNNVKMASLDNLNSWIDGVKESHICSNADRLNGYKDLLNAKFDVSQKTEILEGLIKGVLN